MRRAPSLPERGEGKAWHALTVRWWRDVWRSPMAQEYLRADAHALFRLAVLVDMFWREPSTKLAAEIRIEQQAFGITPLDRRRLEWSIEDGEEDRAMASAERVVTKAARKPPIVTQIVPDDFDPRTVLAEAG